MKYFIMSDIHGNLEALESALEVIERRGSGKIVVLGDIVGYMCNPNECIEKVKNFDCIKGNHDYAVVNREMLGWFNENAKKALLWTISKLEYEKIEFLDLLPYVRNYEGFTVVHGDITAPEKFNYIKGDRGILRINFEKMEKNVLLVGHTHYPCVFVRNNTGKISHVYDLNSRMNLDVETCKYIINVGSVGQPRDGDKRGCFVMFDDENMSIEYVRFEYDIFKTAQKMIENHMPEMLYKRLYIGR